MKNEQITFMQLSILAFVFMFIFGVSTTAWSATYYVSSGSGNDSNSGNSVDNALKTIQTAADRVAAGDTCTVFPGSYNERVTINTSGAFGQPIYFKAEGSVITRGFNVLANYVTVEGFEVTNTISGHWRDGTGIYVEGKHCKILNNYIHDVVDIGIRLLARPSQSDWTSYCAVKGNRILRAGLSAIKVEGQNNVIESNDVSHTLSNGYGDSDGIRFAGSGHIIQKNNIHDIYITDPGNQDSHIDCFQTWGPASNIVLEQNNCDNNNDKMQGFMIEEQLAPVESIMVKNNTIRAFRMLNVHDCENISIVNNSFKSDLSYSGESGYGIELHNSPNAIIMNNLFYDVGRHIYPYLIADSVSNGGLNAGYNCVYMSDGQSPAGSPRTGDLWQVDPRVTNAVNGDFYPNSDSPLIDSGGNAADVQDDFNGTSRPQGDGLDIGAFEYESAVNPQPPKGLKII